MSEDATQYLERADEALQLAEKSINPLDREIWLRVAGEWFKIAQSAEMQARVRPPQSAASRYGVGQVLRLAAANCGTSRSNTARFEIEPLYAVRVDSAK